jgi:hypothetical protein
MRITACTERIFLSQLVPLAHLPLGEVCAVNDNELQFPMSPDLCPRHEPRSVPESHAAQRAAQEPGGRPPGVIFTPERLSEGS